MMYIQDLDDQEIMSKELGDHKAEDLSDKLLPKLCLDPGEPDKKVENK